MPATIIQPPDYPLARWFARPYGRMIRCRKGREYTGKTHNFVQTLRNQAFKLGLGLSIAISDDETEVTFAVRKKGPRGRKPGSRNGRK